MTIIRVEVEDLDLLLLRAMADGQVARYRRSVSTTLAQGEDWWQRPGWRTGWARCARRLRRLVRQGLVHEWAEPEAAEVRERWPWQPTETGRAIADRFVRRVDDRLHLRAKIVTPCDTMIAFPVIPSTCDPEDDNWVCGEPDEVPEGFCGWPTGLARCPRRHPR